MHKIRNEKASAIFQKNSTRVITKTKYIIGNLNLSFQVKQVKFLCAISSKGPHLLNRFNSKYEKTIVSFLCFKKKPKLSILNIENPHCYS